MMNRKLKIATVFCIGAAAVIFIANATLQHQAETSPTPQICPVCDFAPVGKGVPPPVSETAGVEPVPPETGTQTPPLLTTSSEPQIEPTPMPETPPIRQPSPPVQAVPAPTSSAEPQMGDTRILDGQKQVYFLGFGWIEDNDTPNECVYAEDMYENGNKVGSMGGEVGRSCGDISKMVGSMD